MDLSRRRFLGASGTAALTAGGLFVTTAQPAAAIPAAGPAFSSVDAAVIARLARLMSVFPMPFPNIGAEHTDRIARPDLDGLTASFTRARRQRVRVAIQRLAPYANAVDAQLLAAIARIDSAGIVPAVAVAARLVSDRSDPARDDGATVWLAAVRRHVGEGGAR
ncbi:hypothetical protein [Flindersiella endophytica]